MLGRARPEEGYRPDFDMSFYDPEGYVSRRHAHILKARNGYFVTDLGSSNGTYVNDQPLTPQKTTAVAKWGPDTQSARSWFSS